MQPDRSSSEACYATAAGHGQHKRSKRDNGRPRAPIRSASQSATKRKQDAEVVLIVDDDPDIREAIRTLLEEEGYPTAEACNGQEALALIQQPDFKAGLILLDLMMPTMDGLQLRARLRADPALAAIPVVVMSAHEAMLRALEHSEPPTPVLRKPLDLDQLLELVTKYRS